MKRFLSLAFIAIVTLGITTQSRSALAISPRNPYRSFNLSGVNYGSMRWERTQRQKQSSRSYNNWSSKNARMRPDRTRRVDRYRNGLSTSNDKTTQNNATGTSSR